MRRMIDFFKSSIESKKSVKWIELVALCLLFLCSIFSFGTGMTKIHSNAGQITFVESIEMVRNVEEEDFDEDYTVCDVEYTNGTQSMIISYSYDDYLQLDGNTINAYVFETENGTKLYFDHKDVSTQEIRESYKQKMANDTMAIFNLGTSTLILFISVLVMFLFAKQFTTYEKVWFLSIMVLATIFSVIFPEESANGVNGIVIMLLYLLDTFLNILCELLISKQSRYNFLVSVLVEIVEIVMCIVLMYRFATMVTTLFFWLPIDILSFVNWTKHKDDQEDQLTAVRSLKGYQEVLVILAIVVWTVVVGYFLSGLDIATDFYHNKTLETAVIYIDACASAVGVANGLFIFFRMREQWIAWYICAFLESIINIISGQYVLLILKLGYFTNTTYGYIKWSRYIKSHKEEKLTLF
ncbi:nicotinamide riboside transporter PnuC [Floccifex sp.]|uniref:nicotinamide riboside transporter PnuC n=1 Tax=Floccifex sp. TaxID=2815810 RepID=UPI003F0F48B5